jgi:hypothetical protein
MLSGILDVRGLEDPGKEPLLMRRSILLISKRYSW